jgi:hypothetical protein
VKARIAKKVCRAVAVDAKFARSRCRHRPDTRRRAWARMNQLDRWTGPEWRPYGKWWYEPARQRFRCSTCKCTTTWHRGRHHGSPICTGCDQPDIPF